MKLRQEQIVFVIALLLLGFLTFRAISSESGGGRRRGGGGGADIELERFPAPDVALAMPNSDRHAPLLRDLLSPPSDVRPLPLLGIVEPPREPLIALFPPPEPGPSPAAYGKLLRRALDAAIDPDLGANVFGDADASLSDVDYDFDSFEFFEDDSEKEANSLVPLIGEVAGETEDDPFEDLTAAERDLIIAGYKEQYDWYFDEIRTTFGRIENRDRFGLKTDESRASEAFLFVEVLPEKGGVERYPGFDPIEVQRNVVKDWDFAGTFANEIEVRRRELGDAISRSTFSAAMGLADDCVRGRLEAPRALEIAEELYGLCAEFDAADSAPRLGLARCYEAGFEFQKAFDLYQMLVVELEAHAEVHARLGLLEARFFLFEQAEERLRKAVRVDRGSWEARWALGAFLADRGRFTEALEHLDAADRAVPNDPELLLDRVAIRVDLASARLAVGDVEGAHTLFGRALAAAPGNQRARAGWIATELFGPAGMNGASTPPDAGEDEDPGLELLLARGLEALVSGDVASAKEQLDAAAEADPLRANAAWRALSFAAEVAGQDGEARRYVELALQCDPTDPWALYQAGRLAAQDEDVSGARELFLAALDRDLDFVDALAALGEMAYRMGDFEDAERYLERAIRLDSGRVELFALRGLNHLLRRSPQDARDAFEAGRAIDRNDQVSRAGLAWCTYLGGDSEQALVQLRELDDSLRDRPEEDPMRTWTRNNIARIQDHEEKVEWSDNFDRKTIMNDWDYRDAAGPGFRIVEDSIVVEGTFSETGAATLFRTKPAALFVAVEADVWIDPSTKADVGIFLARESRRRTDTMVIERAAVVRHHDGSLQVNLQKEGNSPKFVDMEEPFPTGEWVRLRIERHGIDSDARVTLLADGVPLIENVAMTSLRANTPLLIGLLAEGEPGRTVNAKLDNFRLVYRDTQ